MSHLLTLVSGIRNVHDWICVPLRRDYRLTQQFLHALMWLLILPWLTTMLRQPCTSITFRQRRGLDPRSITHVQNGSRCILKLKHQSHHRYHHPSHHYRVDCSMKSSSVRCMAGKGNSILFRSSRRSRAVRSRILWEQPMLPTVWQGDRLWQQHKRTIRQQW
jgi:hypothetical protein